MKKLTFLLIIFLGYSCNNVPRKNELHDTIANASIKDNKQKISSLIAKDKLIGFWTDGGSENATFEIGQDSIYYVDQFKSYKYSMQKDSIHIQYDDYTFGANVCFIKDTLVMSSENGVSKFWKFRN